MFDTKRRERLQARPTDPVSQFNNGYYCYIVHNIVKRLFFQTIRSNICFVWFLTSRRGADAESLGKISIIKRLKVANVH